jgi:hypothetical protein
LHELGEGGLFCAGVEFVALVLGLLFDLLNGSEELGLGFDTDQTKVVEVARLSLLSALVQRSRGFIEREIAPGLDTLNEPGDVGAVVVDARSQCEEDCSNVNC